MVKSSKLRKCKYGRCPQRSENPHRCKLSNKKDAGLLPPCFAQRGIEPLVVRKSRKVSKSRRKSRKVSKSKT
jgi:hypothetical protein